MLIYAIPNLLSPLFFYEAMNSCSPSLGKLWAVVKISVLCVRFVYFYPIGSKAQFKHIQRLN